MRKLLLGLIGLLFAVPAVATNLPAGYTELEYIESTGTQYIDTGIKANLETKAAVEYRITEYSSEKRAMGLFGCRDGQNKNAFIIATTDGKRDASTSKMFGQFDTVSPTLLGTPGVDLNNHTIELSKNGFVFDGQLMRSFTNPKSFETAHTIPLFAAYSEGTDSNEFGLGIYAVYQFKLWKNGALVRDFVPAKNASGVVGMYDTVSGNFFTNAGSGTFVAGPVIPEQQIRIATTAYNSARFSPVVTELNDTIATIRDVVTNTINQTAAIADLQATKQTRPDENCPAGKKCLLVEDNDGTPHWYEIVENAD